MAVPLTTDGFFFLFFSFSEVFIYRLCPTSYISQSIFGKNQSRSIFILTCFRSWNSLYFLKISKIIQWKVRRNIIIYISIIFITTVSNSQTPSVKLPTSKEMALSFFRLSKNVLAYFQLNKCSYSYYLLFTHEDTQST